ncbi:hypothetical protein PENSPDRAFT_582946, partial [Peniophora sp. CONT]
YALNIKGLSFKTEWLSFAEVGPKMKALGLAPQEGFLQYTIPTIYDPNTDKLATDSFAIAKYLDDTYPNTPRLVVPGTAGLQEAYIEKVVEPLLAAMVPSFAYPAYEQCCMDETDREYLRRTREPVFGKKLEDMELEGEAFTAACRSVEASLDAISRHVAANGADAVFIAGDSPSHADTAIAAGLVCMVKILGKEHGLSKVILEHGWAKRYLDVMSKWA